MQNKIMKKTILTLVLVLVQFGLWAQMPALQWQKVMGGTSTDAATVIHATDDGGYIMAGYAFSFNGDVSGSHGGSDVWVVKLSNTGVLQWKKAFGGTADDKANSIQPTTDGGYIVAGSTLSLNGQVVGNHGLNDAWVIKINSTGVLQWQKCFGGTGEDTANSIQPTADGGYIMTGATASTNGDVSGNHGSNDAWVVKMSSTGSLEWQKCFGGTNDDEGISTQITISGNDYLMMGNTRSNDGDVSENHGGVDVWVVLLSSTGTLLNQNTSGGTGDDYVTGDFMPDAFGFYKASGYSNSNDGDLTLNHGGYDAWVMQLSEYGYLFFSALFGGTGNDYATRILPTVDNGCIMAGYTQSNNGTVTGNHGGYDAWFVKLESNNLLEWQKTLGGTGDDYAYTIQHTNNGGYIVAASTGSNNGDVSGNHGFSDAWVMKLAVPVPAPTATNQFLNSGSTVADLVATGSNLQWYTAVSDIALAANTVLVSGTYYVSQTVGGVESPRTMINVTLILAPYTAISDAVFEQKLIDLGIDSEYVLDNKVLISDINTVTTLDISYSTENVGSRITDLTGIRGFTSLTTLNCNNNHLTSLNLSGMVALTTLDCGYNHLTSLNVSGLDALTTLDCKANQLTSLNVSGLNALTTLDCSSNQLTSLNIIGLNALTTLECADNQLTSLNASGLTSLSSINCGQNQLTTLNLSGSIALGFLNCLNNQLTNLNLSGLTNLVVVICGVNQLSSLNLSESTNLIYLICYYNQLTSLNLSGLTNLQYLFCQSNQLTSLNLNGDTLLSFMYADLNPNLTCISVSDPIAAAANIDWQKDATANYSTNCGIAIPTTEIKPSFWNTTLASLNIQIIANVTVGAQMYRFEVSNGGISNTYEVAKYYFDLTKVPGTAYATTYSIRVALKIGGTWGDYGNAHNVTTPALVSNTVLSTKLLPAICGVTLPALDTKIGAVPVYGVNGGYRFEITKGGIITIYDSPTYNFRLAQAGVAAYGTTYSIRVAAQVNGVYGNYDAACSVTTPVLTVNLVPTTNIIPSLCGTTLASKDAKITAVMITGATNGRYEITKAGSAPVVYEIASTVIKLSQTGVVLDYNTAYTIRVAAFIGGVWGNYGSSCTVTTPAAPIARLKVKTFEVTAYPNPFETAFNLNLETPSKEEVTIAVYDMMGKLLETHQVNPTEVANLQIGSSFAAGIYNVIVSQANDMQAIRLIRR